MTLDVIARTQRDVEMLEQRNDSYRNQHAEEPGESDITGKRGRVRRGWQFRRITFI